MGIADLFKQLFDWSSTRTPSSNLSSVESAVYDIKNNIWYRFGELESKVCILESRISILEEIIKKGADNSDSQEV